MRDKQLRAILDALIGKPVTQVQLGHGSFLTFDFGQLMQETTISKNGRVSIHWFGEWHLWVYMCAWRIDKNDTPFVSCEDDRIIIADKVQALQGTSIVKYEILNIAYDTKFYFGDNFTVTLFGIYTADPACVAWYLYDMQVGKVLTVRAGGWLYEKDSL